MSRSSCIPHPQKEQLAIIRKWQIEFCEGNVCAAALLSYYEYWHNIKLEMRIKNSKANDIAEMHHETRAQDESLLQFHTLDELTEGILGIFSKSTIAKANKYLEEKEVISVYDNPNPRYKFDRTRYVLFHPEVCIHWIKQQKPNKINAPNHENGSLDQVLSDREVKLDSRDRNFTTSNRKFTSRCDKFTSPQPKNTSPITEITTETTTEKKAAAGTIMTNPTNTECNEKFAAASFSPNHVIENGKLTDQQIKQVEQFISDHFQSIKHIGDRDTLKQAILFDLANPQSFTQAGNDFYKKLNTIKKAMFDKKWSPSQWLQESQNKTKQNAARLKQKIQELELFRQSFINASQEMIGQAPEFKQSCQSKIKQYEDMLIPLYQQLKQPE